MIKYRSIDRAGTRNTHVIFEEGNIITIQEKLDGSNTSFTKDDIVRMFSRNRELFFNDDMNGFWKWVNEIFENGESLNPNYIYYGEWIYSGHINYPAEMKKKFYLFDILDKSTGMFLDHPEVYTEGVRLQLNQVQTFYYGEFISYDHIKSFVDHNIHGVDGEGVVVKTARLKSHDGEKQICKLVSKKFAEVSKQKEPKERLESECQIVVRNFLNLNRIRKIHTKLVDEENYNVPLAKENMRQLIAHIVVKVIEDIYKEESELLNGFDSKDVQSVVQKVVPSIIIELINEKENDTLC